MMLHAKNIVYQNFEVFVINMGKVLHYCHYNWPKSFYLDNKKTFIQ